MIVIDRNRLRIVELAWLVAFLAELGHERSAIIIITRKYLHSMVVEFDDEQETSMMVEHQARRATEQAISLAFSLGADRELDSSISIKSIVPHLFQIYLSLPRNDKEIFSTSTNLSIQPRDRDAHAATTRRRTKERTAPPTSSVPLPHDHTHTRTRSRTPSQSLSISRFVLIGVALCLKISCSSMCASVKRRRRGTSKEREDLEQQLVRNHRHRRLAVIDQRSNHRHRRYCLLHP